ncbi:MAG: thiamine pyrophosphate-binding protein [Burkholderiaceae bacterium]|nr:thiamine pyrophosphate-binding protein [Burkholderiaceae bacterium]
MRGADLLVQTMASAGVRTVFSLSGNQIMPVYDACLDAGIRIVHTRHEAAAVFMADAWSQLTGEPGVALVTAGGGFGNALGALISARAAESAVVLLSGDSPRAQDGMGAFQEFDQVAASTPFTKWSHRSREAAALGDDFRTAHRLAGTGRPGPVHLALPVDLLNATLADAAIAGAPAAAGPAEPASDSLDRLRQLLGEASRPLVLTGPQLNRSRAGALLDALVAATGAPVVSMESPRGLRDPSLGAFADVFAQADLLVYLGKAPDFTTDFGRPRASDAQVVLVAPERELIERGRRLFGDQLALALEADAMGVADALVVDANGDRSADRTQWRARCAAAIASRALASGRAPAWVSALNQIQAVLDAARDPVLIVDGGEFGQWAQAFLSARTRVINGCSGTIGGSLACAVAASLARPEATVIALLGDGTVGFHLAELETAARAGARFVAIIGNDGRWNAEHLIQLRDYGAARQFGCELDPATDYAASARALGIGGERVEVPEALGGALQRAQAAAGPFLIDMRIEGRGAPVFASAPAIGGGH